MQQALNGVDKHLTEEKRHAVTSSQSYPKTQFE